MYGVEIKLICYSSYYAINKKQCTGGSEELPYKDRFILLYQVDSMISSVEYRLARPKADLVSLHGYRLWELLNLVEVLFADCFRVRKFPVIERYKVLRRLN